MVTHAEALSAGLQHHQAGRFAAAEGLYRQVLDSDPDNAEALRLLGVLAQQHGKFDLALELQTRAVALQGTADQHQCLGSAYEALGRLDEAEASYRQALALNPAQSEALLNLGNVFLRRGNRALALRCYEEAVRLAPNSPLAHYSHGNILAQTGQGDAALASYRRALEIAPTMAPVHAALSKLLQERGELLAAITHARRWVTLKPDNPQAHNNIGFLQFLRGDFGPALDSYRKALALAPDFAQAHNNIGVLHYDQADVPRAMEAYERTLTLDPTHASAHMNRGMARLLSGDFGGWADYEWRWRVASVPPSPGGTERPFWAGAPLDGTTILLSGEQGIGDTLQFLRYVPMVAARGGRVILHVKPALRRLLTGFEGVETLVCEGDPLPPFDTHCPLLSLPLAFGTELATVPATVPYLRPPEDLAAAWRQRFADPGLGRALKVGLVWAGWQGHRRDRARSVPLALFEPLAAVTGVRFFALQKGPAAGQTSIAPRGLALRDLAPQLDDLADTAAAIAALDLVITVDTSLAHLAGALGKPVWILLSRGPDWRWLLDREDSPWYPTARLFRQADADDWEPVLARVAGELRRLVAVAEAR